jgi:hypothetical protein
LPIRKLQKLRLLHHHNQLKSMLNQAQIRDNQPYFPMPMLMPPLGVLILLINKAITVIHPVLQAKVDNPVVILTLVANKVAILIPIHRAVDIKAAEAIKVSCKSLPIIWLFYYLPKTNNHPAAIASMVSGGFSFL